MNGRSAPVAPGAAAQLFGRLKLRWLVLALTLAGMGAFIALALEDRRAAPLALAGALLIGAKGTVWLFVLRRNRARLRRSGLRW